eukprot:scaffold130083_cov29-Prasinocladus_malaysianus.AAC.1
MPRNMQFGIPHPVKCEARGFQVGINRQPKIPAIISRWPTAKWKLLHMNILPASFNSQGFKAGGHQDAH